MEKGGTRYAATTAPRASHNPAYEIATAIRAQHPVNPTRTCNKLLGVYMYTGEPMRNLDRGVLARIDRKLLAGLGQDETYRMVRVPVTASKWSTWRRYCESTGISMGRAIVALIDRELVGVFGDEPGDQLPVFAEQAEEELVSRREQVARREEKAAVVEGRLRAWDERLRTREVELETRERRVELTAKMAAQTKRAESKVGRNQRCPCGSGLKYKHCHGLPSR